MQVDVNAHVTAWPQRLKRLCGCLLVLGLPLSPIGCSTANPGNAGPAPSAHARGAALELNAGKKWGVAQPMRVHLRNLEKAVQDFDHTPERDHAALAASIQDNLGLLVTNCTMEGKAHDELHKWLMPFLGLSAEYSKTTDPQVQQQKLQEIKQALLVFNDYFE